MDIESSDRLGFEPLFRLFKNLDLPRTPISMSKKRANFIQQMARVRRILSKDVFIPIRIKFDTRNRSRNILVVDIPIATSILPSYNEKVEGKTEYVKANSETLNSKKKYMFSVIQQLETNGNVTNCSIMDEAAALRNREIEKVVDATDKLFGKLNTIPRVKNIKPIYVLVDNLQKITDEHIRKKNSSLNARKLWRPYMEELLRDVKGVDLSKDQILVSNIEYMKDVAYLLETTDEVVLEAAIWWMVVKVAVPYSSTKLQSLQKEYIGESVMAAKYDKPKSLSCVEIVKKKMAMAISWLYVDPNFHKGKGIKVAEMLDDIKLAFASRVAEANWIDHKSKPVILKKSENMTYEIGHPDWLFVNGKINEYYKGIDLRDDTYLENILAVLRLTSQADLKRLNEINFVNKTIWSIEPVIVNAKHNYIFNHITVPAGILQFPFYDLGLEALNYGAIGSILGHELTHGFDNRGRLFDANGKGGLWWSNETINRYIEKAVCFENHYKSYHIKEIDRHINGQLTLNENIADNGGLHEAIFAYEKWKMKHGEEPMLPGFTHLTHEQLLFLGFAQTWCAFATPEYLRRMVLDPHCPGFVRVNGVLKNSQEFSNAWQCPSQSKMNPAIKCKIW